MVGGQAMDCEPVHSGAIVGRWAWGTVSSKAWVRLAREPHIGAEDDTHPPPPSHPSPLPPASFLGSIHLHFHFLLRLHLLCFLALRLLLQLSPRRRHRT